MGRRRRADPAGKALDSLKLEGDQAVGVALIRKAIDEPLRWIATNAGQEGSIVVVTAGVIDPVKVVRTTLQHAWSQSGPAPAVRMPPYG